MPAHARSRSRSSSSYLSAATTDARASCSATASFACTRRASASGSSASTVSSSAAGAAPTEEVVKSWIDESGATHERVFDVACSDGLTPDPKTHRCPDNGASVDLDDCSISLAKGDAQLVTLWNDPTFDPTQRALYYARVLQNPTCRWSTWEAIRLGLKPTSLVPATTQERSWSSPISIVPAARALPSTRQQ